MIICLVGPAGSGKTTVTRELIKAYPNKLRRKISVTTRLPRENEQDGVDYYFYSLDKFKDYEKNGKFFEVEEVHGNFYGTLKSELEDLAGKDLICDIDIRGAFSLKRAYGDRVKIVFLTIPTKEELRDRMVKRGTTNEEELKRRLHTAELENEMARANKELIDLFVMNNFLDETLRAVTEFYKSN